MSVADTYQLLELAVGGNSKAHGDLLERLRPRVVMWCAARMSPALRARVEPDDVAQEVLIGVHRHLPSFDGRGEKAFFGWLFRVAENRIRDLVDYHGALKRQAAPPVSFSQTSPSMMAARTEAAQRIQEALAELPEDYRTVIQLRRIEERPLAEVAELMERTVDASRVMYWRAVKALKRIMRLRAQKGGDGVG